MSYSVKEFSVTKDIDYSKFGKPYSNYPSEKDPVECCLPGSFLNCPKVANLGNCEEFMSERCSKNFDKYCEQYSNTLNNVDKFREFIRKSASKKFCELNKNSNCSKECEPMFPIDQESPMICKTIGKEPMLDSSQNLDIGVGKNTIVSGVYMGNCLHDCNKTLPENIEENDPIINTCLKYGICNDILINVCNFSKTDTFKNKDLETFCKELKKETFNKASPFQSTNQKEENEYSSIFKAPSDNIFKMDDKIINKQDNNNNDFKSTLGNTSEIPSTTHYSQPGSYNNNQNKTTLYDYLLFFAFLVLFCVLLYYIYQEINTPKKYKIKSKF